MKNNQKTIRQLSQFLNEVNRNLPLEDINNIVEFIKNNEFGLAYETLCSQLYEYNVKISLDFYEKISLFGRTIETQPSTWLPLKELIMIK